MKVLVLDEKHGHEYVAVPMNKESAVILFIVKERHKAGWYKGTLDETDERLLKSAVDGDNLKDAVEFFRRRRRCEYEDWDMRECRVLPLAIDVETDGSVWTDNNRWVGKS